jgi:RNA polymerase sigma factor (sigma-70 family)
MVVDTAKGIGQLARGPVRRAPRVPDSEVITQRAVREATRTAAIVGEGGADATELDERRLFSALQTCAFHATDPTVSKKRRASTAAAWAMRWKRLRDHIVQENLGLAYAMTKRFRCREVEWDDMRSEALLALVRAVEGFNPWWGYKFSTYACNVVARALIQLARKAVKYRTRFPVERESWLEEIDEGDSGVELYVDRLNRALDENLAELSERETLVLGWRFPKDGRSGLTLGQVGEAIGLSKERVRQIQDRALGKLRAVLDADPALQ